MFLGAFSLGTITLADDNVLGTVLASSISGLTLAEVALSSEEEVLSGIRLGFESGKSSLGIGKLAAQGIEVPLALFNLFMNGAGLSNLDLERRLSSSEPFKSFSGGADAILEINNFTPEVSNGSVNLVEPVVEVSGSITELSQLLLKSSQLIKEGSEPALSVLKSCLSTIDLCLDGVDVLLEGILVLLESGLFGKSSIKFTASAFNSFVVGADSGVDSGKLTLIAIKGVLGIDQSSLSLRDCLVKLSN